MNNNIYMNRREMTIDLRAPYKMTMTKDNVHYDITHLLVCPCFIRPIFNLSVAVVGAKVDDIGFITEWDVALERHNYPLELAEQRMAAAIEAGGIINDLCVDIIYAWFLKYAIWNDGAFLKQHIPDYYNPLYEMYKYTVDNAPKK